jgi:hypothetical protein
MILRGVICTILFLVAWEMCVRIDQKVTYGAPLLGPFNISTMLTYDELGVKGRPYGRYLKFKLNSHGYRSPEPQPDREQIISVGASETFGMFESEDMEYPRQLERELNARAGTDRYQVLNVALAGQSIGAFVRRADQVADDLHPRVALIYPSFLPYINPPADGREPVEWVKSGSSLEPRLRSKLFNLIDSLPAWVNTARYSFHIWKATRHASIRQRLPQSNVDRFHEDLSRLLDRLQERHILSVLVTHATYFGNSVEPDERHMLIAWRRFEPTLAEEGFLDMEKRMNRVIRQEAAARKIRLIDAETNLDKHEYFADWVHFTDVGAHQMATIIADGLFPQIATDR